MCVCVCTYYEQDPNRSRVMEKENASTRKSFETHLLKDVINFPTSCPQRLDFLITIVRSLGKVVKGYKKSVELVLVFLQCTEQNKT